MRICDAIYAGTDTKCVLEFGHLQNHKGPYNHGSIQWPNDRNWKSPSYTLYNEEVLILTNKEVKELQRFLFSVGYISYTDFEAIHELSKRIDAYLTNSKQSNPIPEGSDSSNPK